ncbi:hypothetical protein [Microcoleus vaginatus]|nr:hypothetical protein [Microcoleus sp. FACHB-DQ6]MBD1887571.1 hypothetical protein [Microcoleus sp. FACHB-84]
MKDELQVNLKLKYQNSQTTPVGAKPANKWGKAKNFNYLVIKLVPMAND